jgi:hypothetical protein
MHKNRGVRDGPENGWGKLLNWTGRLEECP